MEKQYSPSAPITGLIIDGAFSVELTIGNNPSITVIGDVDVTPKVRITEIASKNDETVLIKVTSGIGKCKLIVEGGKGGNLRQIELLGLVSFEIKNPIETTELLINIAGAASAHIDGVFDYVVVESKGTSSIHITGTAHSIVVDASGASKVDISELEYQEAEINASGVSHISVKQGADNKVSSSGISSISLGAEAYQNEDEDEDDGDVTILSAGNVIIKTTEGNADTNLIENKVVIKDDGKTETITIGPYDVSIKQNQGIKWSKRKSKFDGHWGGIELGINGYNTADFNMEYPEGYEYLDLRFPKSMAFYLNLIELNIALAKNQKWGMLSGLGFEWHNYRFLHDVWLDTQNNALQGYYINGAAVKKTKLMVSYMTVPLIFEFQTNNKSKFNSFHVGVGVVGGLRIGTHTKAKFENKNSSYYLMETPDVPLIIPEDNHVSANKIMKEHNDFYLNPVKLDATARIGWSHINLFATYSLTPMFRENRAPELYPWSVGITLLGW
jgi:hypothetical protein